jgi:hypothetical protein
VTTTKSPDVLERPKNLFQSVVQALIGKVVAAPEFRRMAQK